MPVSPLCNIFSMHIECGYICIFNNGMGGFKWLKLDIILFPKDNIRE